MSVPFDPRLNLIVVRARLWGPDGNTILRLALDTGSTSTLVNQLHLISVGYDPVNSADNTRLATGSSVEIVPGVRIDRIDALQQTRRNLRVVCHTLPLSTGVDGLLGLDFLREGALLLDFRKGEIKLT